MNQSHLSEQHQYLLTHHLEKIMVFKSILDHRNLTAAAKQLKLTQSNLSHTLKILEELLGVKLVVREARGVRATPQGELLYRLSQQVYHACNHTELQMRNLGKSLNQLKVCTHEYLATHSWPPFMLKLQKQNSPLHFNLISDRIDSAIENLLQGRVELALTVEPEEDPRIEKRCLSKNSCGFYIKASPLQKKWTRREIQGQQIFTDTDAHLRQNLRIPDYLRAKGINLDHCFLLNSFEASIRLAAEGLGICFIPEMNPKVAAKHGLQRVEVEGITGPDFGNFEIHLSWLKANRKELEPAIAAISSYLYSN